MFNHLSAVVGVDRLTSSLSWTRLMIVHNRYILYLRQVSPLSSRLLKRSQLTCKNTGDSKFAGVILCLTLEIGTKNRVSMNFFAFLSLSSLCFIKKSSAKENPSSSTILLILFPNTNLREQINSSLDNASTLPHWNLTIAFSNTELWIIPAEVDYGFKV